MTGEGQIIFGDSVTIGVYKSPNFWEGYSYLESRNVASSIRIGDNTVLNNGFVAVSAGASITIGNDCVFAQIVLFSIVIFIALAPIQIK